MDPLVEADEVFGEDDKFFYMATTPQIGIDTDTDGPTDIGNVSY